jgi:hypothetical protein
MTLTIDLPPELERQVHEEAAKTGQEAAEYVRSAVEEKLAAAAAAERSDRVIALLDRWEKEDTENPEPGPPPTIPRLSLREVTGE